MNSFHRGFIFPLILVIIALLIASGGAYVYSQKHQSPAVTQTTQATSTTDTLGTQTAGWETYTNTKYHYSIKYPKDFFITFDSSPTDQSQSFWVTNFPIDWNLFIGIGHPVGKMLIKGDVYDSSLCHGIPDESNATVVMVNGVKVKRVASIATDGGESEDSYYYVIPKTDKNCFIINLYPYPIDTNLLQESDKIISTFKLNP